MENLKYSINIKYWYDGHDHSLFFATREHAIRVYKALESVGVHNYSGIEFIGLWDEEHDNLLLHAHF